MYLSNKLSTFLALATYSFLLTSASPQDDAAKNGNCNDPKVRSAISSIKTSRRDGGEPYCSTYLHYTQPVTTTTITTVSTTVVTSTVKKGTTTVTTTVTKGNSYQKRECRLAKRDALPEPQGTVAADSSPDKGGYPDSVVSDACSCIVKKPTKTSTITKTSTKVSTSTTCATEKETKTITVTTKKSSSTSKTSTSKQQITTKTTAKTTSKTTTSSTITTKTTSKSVSTTKTSSTTSPTTTGSLTQCSSANPTFIIQFQDPDSARTDEYNGQYLATAPDTVRGSTTGRLITTTTSRSDATVVILDLVTRRLISVSNGYFGDAPYFSNLTPVYFDPASYIDANGYQYFDCAIVLDVLTCSVPDPSLLNVFQTCPEYVDLYDSPVALGDHEYTDGPVCYRKNLVVIPVCTPL